MTNTSEKHPEQSLMEEISEIMAEVYRSLIENDRAYEFIAAMQKRAELTTRQLPSLPTANRDMATGQISICYELADGAKTALDAAISEAKERAANKIRKGASDTQ